MALQANFCRVALERPGPNGVGRLLCTRRTRMDKCGRRICTGDRVLVEAIDWTAARGVVASLEPRSNRLNRPSVANVDRMLVVVALGEPALDALQLTRFLPEDRDLGIPGAGQLHQERRGRGEPASQSFPCRNRRALRAFRGGQEQPAQLPGS